MSIPSLDRPLATTKQFRDAVRQVLTDVAVIYTDKPKCAYKVDNGRRNLLLSTGPRTEKDIEAIEFILWAQGVTAHTRMGSIGIRGTCFLQPKE